LNEVKGLYQQVQGGIYHRLFINTFIDDNVRKSLSTITYMYNIGLYTRPLYYTSVKLLVGRKNATTFENLRTMGR